ncbi:MAG TPA: hypothetical protein VLF94_05010 [Chlamydiales bacterium]|nr:hypothetical protein [Chlamydiales bacterium]
MDKPVIDHEERVFTLGDVKRLYIAQRRRMIKWALFGAIGAFIGVGILSPKYKVEATFKEGVEKADAGGALQEILGGSFGNPQPQAASLMRSSQVLKPLVEKMGLQISSPRTGWIVKKVFKRYRDNLRATRGLPLDDLDPFIFQDVVCEAESKVGFGITFINQDHFAVRSADQKRELARGVIGAEVFLPEFEAKFTLAKAPLALKLGHFYPFSIGNWAIAAEGLRKDLQIANDKNNKSIYQLSLLNRDRHLGSRILNELMFQYQCYLKREHDVLAKEQLAYLENKQEQLYGKLDTLLGENVEYLAKNIDQHGFCDLEQGNRSLLIPHEEMHRKIHEIDLELASLDGREKGGFFSEGINPIMERIQDLKQQRDLLELSLCQVSERSLETRRDDLKEVRNQRLAVEKLIQEVDRGQEISSCDLNQGLSLWATGLQDVEEREDFSEYLENYARLLSVREKMLQERFFYANDVPSELQGIDLLTARALFVQYNTKLDGVEASKRHYETLKAEIHSPSFEIASLSSVLTDAFSQTLIREASETGLRLKDEKYHSSKEGERYEEQIALQKKILSNHLDQLYKVEELNETLIREKLAGLQKISLDCINQEISVLHEQVNDTAKNRTKALLQEKKILEKKMGEIRSAATSIPEKWRLEQWLRIKMELLSNMMGTITEVVESKTISHHLHHVESKPLDGAIAPPIPQDPHLYLKTFLGAFFFGFGVFFLSLIRQILKGFPTTLEKLQALRLPTLGAISAFCDGPSVETPMGADLELLRKLALFAQGGKVIGLLGGSGPDYSFALSENLARMAMKSIVLRCDFLATYRKEDCPGLLQVWKGEVIDLPIRKGKGFDYITSGGYTPFGAEMIQSQRFIQLVALLKKNYDWVFILLRTPLSSAESIAALRLCDKAVVTVSGEQTEELTPFIAWAYHEDQCRLTFVSCS